MGVCALCVGGGGDRKVEDPKQAEKKKRVLVLELEKMFNQYSGEDKMLSQEELVQLWMDCSRKHGGKVDETEVGLIKKTAAELFKSMDTDGSGKASYREFVNASVATLQGQGALRGMRDKMNEEIKAHPEKLEILINRFKQWDSNGDGYVTKEELEFHLTELSTLASSKGSGIASLACCVGKGAALAALGEPDPADLEMAKKLKDELLEVADLDGDGKVDLWEAIAWTLGRRKVPVELLLYDISKGATNWLGPLLLARTDVEAFHSAILVFGSEFWYGGKVFRTEPPCTKQFGNPLTTSKVLQFHTSETKPDLKVVKMGYTFVTHEEFLKFLKEKVVARYTGLEKYDLLTHSCNHFSDECLQFLVGHGVPDHVLELQRMALTPTVKAMRPYLNKYLGGFSQEGGGGDHLWDDHPVSGGMPPTELLGEGTVATIDAAAVGGPAGTTVVATIISESADKCEVRVIDSSTHRLVTKTVPTSAVQSKVVSFLGA